MVNNVENIGKCHVLKKEIKENGKTRKVNYLQTEGMNFPFCWGLDFIDMKNVDCNVLPGILEHYGIEAARRAIIKEVKNVFSAYGIQVDYRHMTLVADFMTFSGGLTPLYRNGMGRQASALLKMSFESTTKFLVDACLHQDVDELQSPSAQLFMGQPVRVGTGKFDILHNFE